MIKWNNKCFFKMLWCQLCATARAKDCWVLKEITVGIKKFV